MTLEVKKTLFLALILTFAASGRALSEEPVYFADANLKAAVEQALGVTDPTPTDMLALTELDAAERGISDLTGLECVVNLTNLYLDGNQISNISAVTSLVNLRRLYLGRNRISDISSLVSLMELRYLWLEENQIGDISALASLTNLEWLWLADNQISDISVLASLTKLMGVDLSRNPIQDMSVLASLANLEYVHLHGNRISDISAIASLTKLRSMCLADNQISDISVLTSLTNLVNLGLNRNPIRDVSALAGLTNLEWLELNRNQISDISALAGLTKLEKLFLNRNQISDISVLASMTKLMDLRLRKNQISDISALAGLKNLENLDLRDNPLNHDAYYIYIPQIRQNSPDIDIDYAPRVLPRGIYVDDDGPNDPVPYDAAYSDPGEDGTFEHPFDTIQEGIDVALDGEIVFVRDGTYRETIDFAGKSIIVTGFDPHEPYPVLNANYARTAVVFGNEEGPDCLLERFVITRGMGDIAGAISCVGSSPTISNCLIVGNRAIDPNGGGAAFCLDSNAVFKNCTFSGNYGGLQSAGLLIYDSNVTIVNSILWGNYAEVSVVSGSLPSIIYSDIQGGWPGTGDMDEPPFFAEPGYWARIDTPDVQAEPSDPDAVWIDGDYHLLSEFGRCLPGQGEWVLDEVTSVCIDSGHPSNSFGEELSPNGGLINMGAYGGTPQASVSSPTEGPIYFTDANLKAAVEQALCITDPTPTDMLALTILELCHKGRVISRIIDLTGLEYAKNLEHLRFSYNQVSDISAVGGLVKLKWLWLDHNQVSDISALTGLKNLIVLDLQSNPLNQDACNIYIPQIYENNPNVSIYYEPCNN